MSSTRNQSQSNRLALFSVERPLAHNNAGNKRRPIARNVLAPKSKRRRTEHHTTHARHQPWSHQAPTNTAEHHTQTDDEPTAKELGTSVQYQNRSTSISDVKNEPATQTAAPNIFKSLDRDEVSWLVEEVNEANKSIFGEGKAAEKLKQCEAQLDRKKTSLSALK